MGNACGNTTVGAMGDDGMEGVDYLIVPFASQQQQRYTQYLLYAEYLLDRYSYLVELVQISDIDSG